MNFRNIRILFLSLTIAIITLGSAYAQNTTSSISGYTANNEESLPGVIVRLVHIESGTEYIAVSNAKGMYRIDGVLPGGPYRLESTYLGHTKSVVNIPHISLGEAYSCNVTLKPGNNLQEVTVEASAAVRKTGSSEHITATDIARIPAIDRTIEEILAYSPYWTGSGAFGGRDAGMSNYSIDGANFNANMGLDREKMPGGGATPFALDAIEEIQIVNSAFDVKNSNFAGAAINAVTKRGTNNLRASAYTFFKNENFRGNRVDGTKLGSRPTERRNYLGLTLGGPIVKDKLFYFISAEYEDSPRPIYNWRASKDGVEDGTNFISRVTEDDLRTFANDLKTMYGWNPGSYTDFEGGNKFTRLMARIDWNISSRHHFMLRYNQTNGEIDKSFSATGMGNTDTPPNIYSMTFRGSVWKKIDKVYSLSGELNSRFADNINNKLRASFTFNDANNRDCDADFPTIEIMKPYEGDGKSHNYMSAGYDIHAWRNGINEKSYNIADNLTLSLGEHFLTFGGEFEATTASNCYMKYGAGYYRYASYDDFLQKKAPVAFAMCWSLTGKERALSDVSFNRLSVYAQDEWTVNNRLRLLYGLRMEVPMYVNDRYENPSVAQLDFNGVKLNTAHWPKARPLFSPRLGFNYDLTSDGSVRLRGGTGLFTSRFPLIFLSKMQEGSGMLQTTVRITNANHQLMQYLAGGVRTPKQVLEEVVPNLPDNLKTLFPTKPGAVSNIVTIDRNFKMPQVWKTTLAADWKMPLPFRNLLTVEGTFVKDIHAITVRDANIDHAKVEANRFSGPDNRFFYPGNTQKRIHTENGYAYMMTNTHKGYSATVVSKLTMSPVKNLDLMAAYTYTLSKTLNSNQSNQIDGAMTNLPTVNGYNYQELSNARYVYTPHRLIASASYAVNYANDLMKSRITLFYEGRRNGSYSVTYNGDLNNDGVANDLLYIPANKNELTFVEYAVNGVTFTADQQRDAFWAFVNQDPYLKKHKGEYAKAFGAFNPWFNRVNLRFEQEFKVKVGKTYNTLQLNLDITNLANLLNNSWGCSKYVSAVAAKPLVVDAQRVDENNEPRFRLANYKDSDGVTRLVDHSFDITRNTSNCWRMQIGVKYIFNL